jgi:hypothetical protein
MLGRKEDWLPARAEPLWHRAYNIVGAEGETDSFAAGLDVQWRIHVVGREPYEFTEEGRRSPLWIIEGAGHGRRWFTFRLRASRGLLREVGVPCRVHPGKPYQIDIDWPRAYDEHQPAWDRMDAVSKGVTARRDGPLGRLLAPIEYVRLPSFTPDEQRAIDREVDAEVARQDAATAVGATADEMVDLATLEAEGRFIQGQQKEAKRLRRRGVPRYATVVDLNGPTGPGSWLYTVRLEIHEADGASRTVEHSQGMNYAMTQRLTPGARLRVRVDPADPQKVAFEAQ